MKIYRYLAILSLLIPIQLKDVSVKSNLIQIVSESIYFCSSKTDPYYFNYDLFKIHLSFEIKEIKMKNHYYYFECNSILKSDNGKPYAILIYVDYSKYFSFHQKENLEVLLNV